MFSLKTASPTRFIASAKRCLPPFARALMKSTAQRNTIRPRSSRPCRRTASDVACFAGTTGYGYNDVGRDTLERVYADCFHTEAALVRPQITCGTHALAVALSANLLPGDELLSPVGAPV